MPLIRNLLNVLSVLLIPLAGPYRVVMYRFRTFGGIVAGLLTWAGVAIAYPYFAGPGTLSELQQDRRFLASWIALAVWSYAQMMVRWCSASAPGDPGKSHSRFGRFEPVAAIGLSFALSATIGPGPGRFFLSGYASSLAQIAIIRLRGWLKGWSRDDVRRLLEPVRVEVRRMTPIAIRGAGRAAFLSRQGFIALMPVGLLIYQGTKQFLRRIYSSPAAPGEVTAVKPPTFMGRVMSHIVASLILSFVTGIISFRTIFYYLSYILAIILWLAGWNVNPPEAIKEEARGVISRTRDAFDQHAGGMRQQLVEGNR